MTAPNAAPIESVNDLLPGGGGGADWSGAPGAAPGKSPTSAEDLADAALRGAGGPTDPGPAVGRGSARAAAGFSRKKSKPELIQLGRELAGENQQLREQLAALQGGGDPATVPEVQVDPAALVEPLTAMTKVLSGFLAAWRGDHWDFTDEESKATATAAAPIVAKKAPQLGEHLDTFVLVMTLSGILLPRLRKDRELAQARQGGT